MDAEENLDQVSLELTDNVMQAVDMAFSDAQDYLTSGVGIAPFSVIVIDEGLEVNDHSADTADDVYESVKVLLAQEVPEGYALCYDGYVETDDGRQDAIVVEAANRGDASAVALAMLYIADEDGYTFEPGYGFAGTRPQLFPAGTKPIVSGMSVLDQDDLAAMQEEEVGQEEVAGGDEVAGQDEAQGTEPEPETPNEAGADANPELEAGDQAPTQE